MVDLSRSHSSADAGEGSPDVAPGEVLPRQSITHPVPVPEAGAAAPAGSGGRSSFSSFAMLWFATLAVPLLVFGTAAAWSWRIAENNAQSRLLRTVDLLHEHALRSLEIHETVLEAVDQHTRGIPPAEIASPGVQSFLAALVARSAPSGGVIIAGPDATIQVGSFGIPAERIDLSDRDYFVTHRKGYAGTYIGEVIVTRPSNTLVFSISRRRTSADGSFTGLIVSSSRANYFEDFYRQVAEGRGDVIALLRDDGSWLARTPAVPDLDRQRLPADFSLLLQARMHGLATGHIVSPIDGTERRAAIRRVGTYPIYVAYGLDPGSVRQNWLREMLSYAIVCGFAMLMLAIFTAMAQRSVHRRKLALAAAHHAVLRRIEAERKLNHSQRVDALGRLVGGVVHDFRNLVNSVISAGRLIELKAGQPDEIRRIARMLDSTADRGMRLTNRMLTFVRRDDNATVSVDVPETIRGIVELLELTLGSGYRIRTELAPGLPPVAADRTDLETVLVNFVLNARDAMPAGGVVGIAARAVDIETTRSLPQGQELQPGRHVAITVTDKGIGMDEETLAKVGEAFFTTKQAGHGTGLGLAMARSFAEQNGGALAIESAPGEGTTITLWLVPSPQEKTALPEARSA